MPSFRRQHEIEGERVVVVERGWTEKTLKVGIAIAAAAAAVSQVSVWMGHQLRKFNEVATVSNEEENHRC